MRQQRIRREKRTRTKSRALEGLDGLVPSIQFLILPLLFRTVIYSVRYVVCTARDNSIHCIQSAALGLRELTTSNLICLALHGH